MTQPDRRDERLADERLREILAAAEKAAEQAGPDQQWSAGEIDETSYRYVVNAAEAIAHVRIINAHIDNCDPSTIAALASELLALREAAKPADDPESILHALQIMAIGAPYSDIQGQLYCHRPYSPDGYRDAEFRDYGLARAVRIICNNAKAIAAALKDPANVR